MDYDLAVNLRPRDALKTIDELTHEVEMAAHFAKARNIGELNKKVAGVLRPLGLDRFCHADLSRENRPGVLGLLDPIGNFDPKVTDRYAAEGFHAEDIMRWHIQNARTPMFRTTLIEYIDNAPFDHDLFKRNRDINKFLTGVGMRDVFNIPVENDTYGIFSVSVHNGDPEKFKNVVKDNRTIIFEVADNVDRILRSKFAQECRPQDITLRLPISSLTITIIDMMAKKDLSGPEVAVVLGIHEQTVQKHIAAGKRALGVSTLPALIMAAIKVGLISVYTD